MGRFLLIITALICLPSIVISNKIGGTNTLKQFQCKNGNKIQLVWKCDGEDDCEDNSDETDPECIQLPGGPCEAGKFMCNDKRCINKAYVCDGEMDCKDGSDESPKLCKKDVCDKDTFECEKGVCIPDSWVCDGSIDCQNGADEQHCNTSCAINMHVCPDGKCIEKKKICDSRIDCSDGSDELNCPSCNPTKDFLCGDKKCIPSKFVCDGDFDCSDQSDEQNCDRLPNSLMCKEYEFQCADKKTCIHMSWVCDGRSDCPRGDDESPDICKNSTCPKGQFQCSDKTCLPAHLVCNGIVNCPDGSDEEKCSTTPICLPEEMNCGGGHCVHISKLCDGIQDCPNGEDEPAYKCNVNECLHKNGGCNHVCVDTTIGHRCECFKGYKLVGNTSCIDVNECDVYGACSQNCHNIEGSYSCSCDEGYMVSPLDHRRCIATIRNAKLIYSRHTGILSSNLDGTDTEVIVGDTKRTRGMDFDYKSGFIFYTDVAVDGKHHIFRSHLSNGKIRTPVISNINKTENLAVDWIYDHIYWTDTGKNTIEVANFDGTMRKTLVSEGLDEPRALALDPIQGYMFWSDWGKEGKIERANMDGTHRTAIVINMLKWPNGVALDLAKQRLYWADAKLYSIHSVNYDGANRKEVTNSPLFLHHPYSLTLFEDWIYWADWDSQAIYRADKFDGANRTNVMPNKHLHDPMVVHIHHPYSQPRHENRCAESQCSHLCFPKPRSSRETISCACPDGLHLLSDGKLCDLIMPPTPSERPVTAKPKTPSDTIIIDFEPDVETTREMDYAILTILIASGVSLLTLFIAFSSLILYKFYLNGNIRIMNFDNPMYKKTATSDPYSAYNIEAQLSYPSTPGEEARHPLTSTLTMESTVYQ